MQKVQQLTGHRSGIYSLSAGRPGHLLSGAGDGWVVDWKLDDPETGRLLARVETQIFALHLLPDLDLVVVGNMNGGVHWVDLQDEARTRNILHHQRGVFAIRRVGQALYSVGGGGLLTRWSVEERRAVESLQLSSASLRCLAYHPGRRELAVGASDHAIYLLDEPTLALRRTIRQAHANSVFCLQYHPSEPLLLSGGRDAHLKVWPLDADEPPISDQPAHWFTINAIAFDPSGRYLATASRDKTVKVWDAERFQLLKVLSAGPRGGHLNSVNALYWDTPDGKLLSAGDDRTIIIWEMDPTFTP